LKKVLFTLMVCVLCAGLVGGAFAYFTDTATSSGNTFTAGTLDLQLSNDGTNFYDGVTSTWLSPANWAPGSSFTATLSATNIGSIDSRHIYFMFSNLSHTDGDADGSNMMNAVIVSQVKERFNSTTTSNQAAYIDSVIGNNDGVLTLAEFAGFANGWYGYFTEDDKTGDGIVLGAGDLADYDLILEFTFDANAGNIYQGDSCSFDITLQATQQSPVDGIVRLHE
jgi:spore coat-associated protein N